MRHARLLGCLVLTLALLGPPSTATASPSAARRMTERINEVRSAYGLPPLRYSPSLSSTSRRFAWRLVGRNQFAHASRIHASSAFSALGEVLAYHGGWRLRIRGTIYDWMYSWSHYRVLMSRRLRYVGAGVARGHFGWLPVTVWVVQLGRR